VVDREIESKIAYQTTPVAEKFGNWNGTGKQVIPFENKKMIRGENQGGSLKLMDR